ncbi:MAG: hypothetical protein OXI56_09125 [bacterium]|nr:hypothetical protein [bacterium]MDE0601937.1 hypothetical protein [bacterium]
MNPPPQNRRFDQPERDWLHQLRRRRAIWASVSFVAVAVTAVLLVNLFSEPEPDPAVPAQPVGALIPHGRNAGGAAAQLLVLSLSSEDLPEPIGQIDDDAGVEQEEEFGTGVPDRRETGPSDAPFLRRRTLTSADIHTIASRYFLEEDVLRAVRLAWCLSRFDPGTIDPTTGHVGLFQHDPGFWPDHAQLAGFRGYDPFDPVANTAVAAYLVYEGAGWQTWDCPLWKT